MTEPWQAVCRECGEPIDLLQLKSYYQGVEGFTRKRDQGGPNRIALPVYRDEYICNKDMNLLLAGYDPAQPSLLDNA